MIKEKYLIRHKILKALYHEYKNSGPEDYAEDIAINSTKISDLSSLSNEQIYSQTDYLLLIGEIKMIEIELSDFSHITIKGRIAYFDKKYLAEGRAYIFKTFREWITLVGTIVAIAISVFGFISKQRKIRPLLMKLICNSKRCSHSLINKT